MEEALKKALKRTAEPHIEKEKDMKVENN